MNQSKRNYGIDLLRIVAMLFVVILHICSYGTNSGDIVPFSQQSYAVDLLQAIAYCAVNCYALISGFVGIRSEQKYTNIAMLWLQGLTYSVVFAVISVAIGIKPFSASYVIKSFLPVMTNRWWYLTKYVVLFFLMPILNTAVKNIPKKKMMLTLIVIGTLYMVSELVFRESVFDTAGGYSVTWLAYLYMVGAYLAYYDVSSKIRKRKLLAIFLACTSCTFLWKVILEQVTMKYTGSPSLGLWLYRYTSPTVLITAIVLLLLFAKVRITKTAIVATLSPLTFGVFLIHTNTFLLQAICGVLIGDVTRLSWPLVIILVIVAAICVFLICGAIEHLRSIVVKKLKIRAKLLSLENRMHSAIDKKENCL